MSLVFVSKTIFRFVSDVATDVVRCGVLGLMVRHTALLAIARYCVDPSHIAVGLHASFYCFDPIIPPSTVLLLLMLVFISYSYLLTESCYAAVVSILFMCLLQGNKGGVCISFNIFDTRYRCNYHTVY